MPRAGGETVSLPFIFSLTIGAIGVEMRAPLSGRSAGILINDRRQRRRRID